MKFIEDTCEEMDIIDIMNDNPGFVHVERVEGGWGLFRTWGDYETWCRQI